MHVLSTASLPALLHSTPSFPASASFQEMRLLGHECKELQRQTEEDADREMEELKER